MKKLLLTGVFKPYGVSDEYGEALCSMELLHNQVTREQGINSPRSNNLSFGLYLIAENIEVPSTVLDFPSWKDFTNEVDKGQYSHIGISFIVPNILKAKRMARYIRQHRPEVKIILGGHGVAIPDLKNMIDYDEICYGEGVLWLRKYFGENTDKPIIHPAVRTSVRSFVYGAPIMVKAGTILPGVGCQNSCSFCSTSHKFDRKYTAFLNTGREIFDACCKDEEELGVEDFALMDENFCKSDMRARQLLSEMEKEQKAYTFSAFSSAEAVTQMGVDFLVRMGINFLWIGVESKEDIFEKTKGIDLHALIADLQDHGISVLASLILFLEHHDKKNIHEEIDWAISMKSDLVQFMQLGLSPGTRLYKEYDEQGKLMRDFPWQRRHGQDTIWFNHPNFTLPESSEYLINAFKKKYETHGPGILNMAHTAVKGYIAAKKGMEMREAQGLVWNPQALKYTKKSKAEPDQFMKLRLESMRKSAMKFRPALKTMIKYSPNKEAVQKGRMIIELFNKTFGSATIKERVMSLAVSATAILENLRFKKYGVIMRQPPVLRTIYKDRSRQTVPDHADRKLSKLKTIIEPVNVAASVSLTD
ncbi:MAG: radical SAM protein [Spirochaetes bacterium]|nr:radical SAM protein [Spirochaetota bacterium]